MKGIITNGGILKIDRGRGGGYRDSFCMFSQNAFCGEDCPHFGERKVPEATWTLELCHGKVLEFETLTYEE